MPRLPCKYRARCIECLGAQGPRDETRFSFDSVHSPADYEESQQSVGMSYLYTFEHTALCSFETEFYPSFSKPSPVQIIRDPTHKLLDP